MENNEENVYENGDPDTYENIDYHTQSASDDHQKDYIEHYQSLEEDVSARPTDNLYEFDQQSSTSSVSDKEGHSAGLPEVKPLASMADQVVDGIGNLSTTEKRNRSDSDNSQSMVYNQNNTAENDSSTKENASYRINLFVKAGSDRECLGCCPFSQRLFMMLWLKGVVFNVTTVDKETKQKQVDDIAPGTNPPFLNFNSETLTDVQKMEDYIEAELYPPRFPKLACKHAQSNTVGNDVFIKFSAFVKFRGNVKDPKRKLLEKKLNDALEKFDKYLNEPLDDEIDEGAADDEPQVSTRKFIDGNEMTIADCNMLPKLNMIRVAGKGLLDYEIPDKFTGIARYLEAASQIAAFTQTCPDDDEIVIFYGGNPKLRRQKK